MQTSRKWPGLEAPHRWRDSEISSTENGAIERVHLPGGRSESKVYSASAANLQIPHRRAEVAGVILPGSKLERI